MTHPHHDHEPEHAQSPTARLLDELQLFGHRPLKGEPDPRPLPQDHLVRAAVADTFDALVTAFADTRLEPDLEDLLWGVVNVFNRTGERIERELDTNEQAQKRSQRDQDGSEVRSVELERLLAEGLTLVERRNAHEALRDLAADAFEHHLRKPWRPHSGSLVSRRTLTATLVDSRDFVAARKYAETHVMMPPGARIAFTGGMECNDHRAIWAALDRVHAKHPDMVLLHGGGPKGAELIAAKWAQARKIVQVAFKPNWAKHQKAAPFKRNDQLLDTLPIGVVVFPGSGICDNLADKARKMGIPLFDFRKGGGG